MESPSLGHIGAPQRQQRNLQALALIVQWPAESERFQNGSAVRGVLRQMVIWQLDVMPPIIGEAFLERAQ